MGDEILNTIIKHNIRIFAFLLFSSTFLYSATNLKLGNDTKEYDKIFEKISETRVGVDTKDISKIKNPFIVIKKNIDKNGTKKRRKIYKLNAIFNHKAMINGKWYKKYSKIGIYKLIKVKTNSVLLRSADKSKELFIRKNHGSRFKFSSK